MNYHGSGIHWKRHIKAHGAEHVETLWYCLFLDKESCESFATMYSDIHNIVLSDDYLNLKRENGLDGGSYPHTDEVKQKLSELKTGKKLSDDTKQKLSIALKGKTRPKEIFNTEWREKQRLSHIDRKKPESTRAKMSAAQSKNNGRALIWVIERKDDGSIFQITALKQWCVANNYNYDSIAFTYKTKKFSSSGFRVISKTKQIR